MVSTVDKPEDKREKLRKLREYHAHAFIHLGVPDAVFLPKLAYRPSAGEEIHISFFESEINKGCDVFVEFTSKELEPEDPERTLYKWRYNANYKTDYRTTAPAQGTGHVRYLVPIRELVKIIVPKKTAPPAAEKQPELSFEILDPNHDCYVKDATLRDVVAILYKKPVSQKPWLNEIIQQVTNSKH